MENQKRNPSAHRITIEKGIPMKLTQRIIYCFFPITGLICIFFSDHVTAVLPYLLGGTMLAVGALRTMICIHPREQSAQNTGKLAQGLIL